MWLDLTRVPVLTNHAAGEEDSLKSFPIWQFKSLPAGIKQECGALPQSNPNEEIFDNFVEKEN